MPSYLPRDFDIVPPLGLQGVLDESLELYYLRATVSIQEEKFSPRQVKTSYGVIKALPAMMNRVIYEVGEPFPMNGQNPIPQRELMKDVISKMGDDIVRLPDGIKEYPDIIIKQRGVSEKIPKAVEDLDQFQGSEFVHYFQHAYGSQYRNFARKLHITGLLDTYRKAKNELLYHNIVKSWGSPVLRKIRSTLVTEAIGTDAVGWSNMDASDVLNLEQALTSSKWWRDVAVSEPVEIDGLRGHIYRSLRYKKRIAI